MRTVLLPLIGLTLLLATRSGVVEVNGEVPSTGSAERAIVPSRLTWEKGEGRVWGRLNLEQDQREGSKTFLVPIIEMKNPTPATAIEVRLDLRALKLRVSDRAGRLIEQYDAAMSGPAHEELSGVIPQSGRIGFHTYFNSVGTPPDQTALITTYQAWVLPPGVYTLAGTVPVEVTTVPENGSPPGRERQTDRQTLELAPITFEVVR